MPLLRVPYTDPLPLPKIIPRSASTSSGAIAALVDFLAPSLPSSVRSSSRINASLRSAGPRQDGKTLLLTGAGISVASGLADYRGTNGTYTMNKTYRPIYFHEFCANHEARKRYWARSFLGWTNLHKARPNKAHEACGELGRLGVVKDVITQSMSSKSSVVLCDMRRGCDRAKMWLQTWTLSIPLRIPRFHPSNFTATFALSYVSRAATNTRDALSRRNSQISTHFGQNILKNSSPRVHSTQRIRRNDERRDSRRIRMVTLTFQAHHIRRSDIPRARHVWRSLLKRRWAAL